MEASSAGKPHHGHHSSTSKQRHSTGFNKAAYRASITRLENELNSPWTPPSKRFRRDIEEVASRNQDDEPLQPLPVPSTSTDPIDPPPSDPPPHEEAPPAKTTSITTSIAASRTGKDPVGEDKGSPERGGGGPLPLAPSPPPPPAPASFHGLRILLVACGEEMTTGRLNIFRKGLKLRGATLVQKKDLGTATHVIVGGKLSLGALLKWLAVPSLPAQPLYHTPEWVVDALSKEHSDSHPAKPGGPQLHRYMPAYASQEGEEVRGKTAKRKARGEPAGDEGSGSGSDSDQGDEGSNGRKRLRGGLACTLSGNPDAVNYNEELTKWFEALEDVYTVKDERFRLFGCKKVVGILKALPYKVTLNNCESLKRYSGIGAKTIQKVRGILMTGRCQRLDRELKDPQVSAAMAFCKIHMVGPKTAWRLAASYTSIADLRARGLSALDPVSRIALARYEDLIQRIPREEVLRIEDTVREALHRLLPGAELTTCGSFRRGKASCGDVDILIAPPPGVEAVDILGRLVCELEGMGFLTDHLTERHRRPHNPHKPHTYMGICRLPQGLHRRLDLKVYPRSMYSTALLYFTGSDHFNRSMRYHAGKNGFRLSDRQLCRTMGGTTRLVCESERDVFQHLGLPYKAPNERNCFDVSFVEEDDLRAKVQESVGRRMEEAGKDLEDEEDSDHGIHGGGIG